MPCKPLFVFLFLISTAAGAQAQVVSQQPFFNVVTLEASATADVPTDTLTITLFTEEQGPDPAEISAKVNLRLEQALARARTETAVQTHSGGYQTYPLYDRANQITGWRIRAELTLESRDFKAAAALAGKLQPALKLSSMVFSLSRAAREAAESTLLADALKKFQEKSGVVAKTLGFPGFTLGQINIRADGPVFRPIAFKGAQMAAMADSVAAAPVPVEGGNNAVTITVSGSVVLGPGK
jgi:predicted secreted protein